MQVFKLPGLKGSSKFMFNSIKFFLINLFIYFWLCWVFVAACGRLSLVAASEGYSSLRCTGFSLRWLLLLRSTGSSTRASVVVACRLSSCGVQALEHRLSSCGGLSCSTACGILPDQGSNPCLLHWQADA